MPIMSSKIGSSKRDTLYEILGLGDGRQLEQFLQDKGNFIFFNGEIVPSQSIMNAIAASSTAMNAIAASSTAMKAIINSQTALDIIYANNTAREIFTSSTALSVKSVPTMTSNTTPEGQAIGSSIYSSVCDYYHAFDKNTSSYWEAASAPPQWLGYMFIVPVFIYKVDITGHDVSSSNLNPNNVVIQCSSDGSSWVSVATYSQVFTSITTTLNIPWKAGFYKYWRVYINSTVGNYRPIIRELNFTGFAQP